MTQITFHNNLEIHTMITETSIHFLLPSLWEVEVTVAASLFVIAAFWFFTYNGQSSSCNRSIFDNSSNVSGDSVDDREKVVIICFNFDYVLIIVTVIVYIVIICVLCPRYDIVYI